jgi:hypothetical protein
MTRIRDLAQAALTSETPAASLEAVIRDLIAAGETRQAIASELDAFVTALRETGGDETMEEEVVLKILDRLRGWCAPDARL